jgi:hydroxymethylbilane synthase
MPDKIIIATRNSPLALWQAEYAKARLLAAYPELQIELLPMTTRGDQLLDVTLNKIGGKGLFLKELEQAMLEGRADIAVHSMKDVPAELPDGFCIGCLFERADASDALVSSRYASLDELPPNAVVGTSSLRRQAQLLRLRPDLDIQPLRGNVQTRLRKLDEGQYAAIVLATAGLQRLGLDQRIADRLLPPQWLPAVAQGAVGVECLSEREDLLGLLAPLNHPETAACVQAERAFNARLEGSCSVAIGALASTSDSQYRLRGGVFAPDGSQALVSEACGTEPEAVGQALAETLLSRGARAILDLSQ